MGLRIGFGLKLYLGLGCVSPYQCSGGVWAKIFPLNLLIEFTKHENILVFLCS